MENPKPVPHEAESKKKKKTKQSKDVSAGLEGFVDWMNLGVSESVKEEEAEISCLVSDFAARMRK